LIDQALHLFGMPRAVTADVLAQREDAKVEDYFHLVLNYDRKRVVLHAATLVAAPGPHFLVHGDAGSFVKYGMDGQEDALKRGERPGPGWGRDDAKLWGELTSADGARQRIATLSGAYQNYYERLAGCLLEGAPVPVDPRDARNGLLVLEAAVLSAAERRTVELAVT
jgi:scyllo-inositol 2-dehydrogenase (NADP+)